MVAICQSARLSERKIFVAAGMILIFAFAIRFLTFFLPHWQGDQSQYVALAMKYDTLGLDGLNLDQIQINQVPFLGSQDWQFVYPVLSKNKGDSDLYRAYEKFGLEFYKLPLFYKSPLFPVVLAVSHRWFAPQGQPFVVTKTLSGDKPRKLYINWFLFKTQFWAVIVTLASSLLTILFVFFFARELFGPRIALYAMFLAAIHPVPLLNSYKILSDDFASFFVITSLFIFYIAHQKKNLFFVFISGAIAGLGILAKQSTILILPSIVLYLFFCDGEKWHRPAAWVNFFKRGYFLWFFLGAFFISAHWFYLVYQVYGNPFFEPDIQNIVNVELSGWHRLLSNRPTGFVLFLMNVPLFCPPYLFGHLSFQNFCKQLLSSVGPESQRRAVLFLWFWVLPMLLFFVFRIESREERYLLPAYPALAILSAYGLSAFQDRFSKHYGKPLFFGSLTVLFLAGAAAWSVPIALESALRQNFLVQHPLKMAKLFYARKAITVG